METRNRHRGRTSSRTSSLPLSENAAACTLITTPIRSLSGSISEIDQKKALRGQSRVREVPLSDTAVLSPSRLVVSLRRCFTLDLLANEAHHFVGGDVSSSAREGVAVSAVKHPDHKGNHISDLQLRVRALETVLIEKGYINPG